MSGEDVRVEFETMMLSKFPTADLRRSEKDEGYVNRSVSWAYWGYLQRTAAQ